MPLSSVLFCLVVAVTDGDTLKARCGEPGSYQQVTVRIGAIDAPEGRQAYGQVSRRSLATLCARVWATISPKAMDRYGRTVADVDCAGSDVATHQIRSGLAWFYVKYGKGYEALAVEESAARSARRGLWAYPDPLPPWDWRASQKTAKPTAL